MDTQHNSTPPNAINTAGLRALTYVVGNLIPDGEIPRVHQHTLNDFACDLYDQAMDIPAANCDDLRWKLENLASDLAANDYGPGNDIPTELKRRADILRADILRLIGTEIGQ